MEFDEEETRINRRLAILAGIFLVIAVVVGVSLDFRSRELEQGSTGENEVTPTVSVAVTPTPIVPDSSDKPGVGDLDVSDTGQGGILDDVSDDDSISSEVIEKLEEGDVEVSVDDNNNVVYTSTVDFTKEYLSPEQYEALVTVAVDLYEKKLSEDGKKYVITWRMLTGEELRNNFISTYYDVDGGILILNVVLQVNCLTENDSWEEVKALWLEYDLNKLCLAE